MKLGDIKSPALLWLKGALFLVLGLLSGGLLLAEAHTLRAAALLALAIWAFCRAYYFAFYAIEKYADPGFRYRGLYSLACYICSKRSKPE